MADLQLLIQQLAQGQINLQNHITALANTQAAPAPAARKKVVADPGTYNGSPAKFHEWWSKIKVWMQVSMQGAMDAKVAVAVYSQPTGPKAGCWAQVHLDHCMAVAHALAAAPAGHNLLAAWPTWENLTVEIGGFFLPRNNREWACAQLLRASLEAQSHLKTCAKNPKKNPLPDDLSATHPSGVLTPLHDNQASGHYD